MKWVPERRLQWQDLLPADVLEGVQHLELLARRKKRGLAGGAHRGAGLGSSVEFKEHREYEPGDDLRRLDWRVMARSDRNVIKQFTMETSLGVRLVVDSSGAMAFRGKGVIPGRKGGLSLSKGRYASHLAAVLARIFLRQGDRVGMEVLGGAQAIGLEGRPQQLQRICRQLVDVVFHGESDLVEGLEEVTHRTKGSGLTVVLSDFLSPLDAGKLRRLLAGLKAKGQEVALIQVLAAEELEFPFEKSGRFRSLIDPKVSIRVDPKELRQTYLAKLEERRLMLESVVGKTGGVFLTVRTDESVSQALERYLQRS